MNIRFLLKWTVVLLFVFVSVLPASAQAAVETSVTVTVLPPKLDGVSNNKVELYVPATSVSAYKSAKNWKYFKTIKVM